MFPAYADTTDQKWMTIVELKKQGMHCVDDPNCFNRYHPEVPEKAKANVGDMIVYHTRDALDSEFRLDSIPADLATVDLGLVHPMTGPVHINGVERGDAIEVEIVDIVPDQYGYTVIAPGFGFLRDVFTEPYIVNWQLTRTGAVSSGMPGITVPYEAFPGSIGVMPGMPEIEKIKAREAGLAAVGGAVLGPSGAGALPADLCGVGARLSRIVCVPFHRVKTVAIWMFSKCRLVPELCFLASSMGVVSLSAMCITLRVMARSVDSDRNGLNHDLACSEDPQGQRRINGYACDTG